MLRRGPHLLWLFAATLCVHACASSGQADDTAAVALVDVTVIPMDTERTLEHHTVVTQGGLIRTVAPSASVTLPRNVRRVDGRGKFVMPGLADFHIHLRSPGEFPTYLAYGVTSVAQMSGAYANAPDILGYKHLISSGLMLGPTIYSSGPLIDRAPLLPHTRAIGVAVGGRDDVERVVAAQKAAGYDMVKIYQMLDPMLYSAVVAEALKHGITPVGHVPQTVMLANALTSGQMLIAHGTFFLEAILTADSKGYDLGKLGPLLALARENNVAVTPTVMTEVSRSRLAQGLDPRTVVREPEAAFASPELLKIWEGTDASLLRKFGRAPEVTVPFHHQLVKMLNEAGVLVVLGTDEGALPGLFPGKSVHDELAQFVLAGLTPYQALATATTNAGQFVAARISDTEKFGRVSPGYRADLVLLDENPLATIETVARPAAVAVRGKWLTRTQLTGLRESARKEFRLGLRP